MKTMTHLRTLLFFFIIVSSLVKMPQVSNAGEKLGVLFISAGESEDYGVRWLDGYFDHLFPFMPKGFFAGRNNWEGQDCYTGIHYASKMEAAVCNAAIYGGNDVIKENVPIDAWCEPHPEYDSWLGFLYPYVHGMLRHSFIPFIGNNSFRTDCYDDGDLFGPVVSFTLLGSETKNPKGFGTLDNQGAHVHDPEGKGLGVADFIEMNCFSTMLTHYYSFNAYNYKSPYYRQTMEWYYGDNGMTNIREVLQATVLSDTEIPIDTEVVFRHGSEAFMKNVDEWGNEVEKDANEKPIDPNYHESVETALDELIEEEHVDRIVVFALSSGYTNLINYGPFWMDRDGNGVSSIEGETYYQCVQDLNDGAGPETKADLDELLDAKPWHLYKTVMSEVLDLNADRVPLTFTRDYGTSIKYDYAILEMLDYIVNAKYSIPNDGTSLKIVLTTHGYSGGYLDGAECDVYFRDAPKTTQRVTDTIMDNFSWNGKFTVVQGPVEYSQPNVEGGDTDPPSPGKPFGDVISAGEQIDMAIKGKYVNELGETVDNGVVDDANNELYDYVILIPNTFDAESSDTLGHMRHNVLGNHELGTVEGTISAWVRKELDQNDLEYGDPNATPSYYPFHDEENFTVRQMDASGWCTQSASGEEVCKGADIPDATRVIVSGTVLSYQDGPARQYVTQAAVDVVMEAIKDPFIGGYKDEPAVITEAPSKENDSSPLSTDANNPTLMEEYDRVFWKYNDDYASCPSDHEITVQYQYRVAGSSTEMTNLIIRPNGEGGEFGDDWALTDSIGILGSGSFELRVVLIDCAGQTTMSKSHYITVDFPPTITYEPVRFRGLAPLSMDPEAPTPMIASDHIIWNNFDDFAYCPFTHNITILWQYRPTGSTDDMTSFNIFPDFQNGGAFMTLSWTNQMGISLTQGTYEFEIVIVDCVEHVMKSQPYYIILNSP
ncbi:MAG: hypothetical protein GY847_39210 [Proteobacteria bacterium]|nr:hypothetical protein [Pseudomonadota bacterium]